MSRVEQLFAAVDNRLLPEVPRFFGGLTAAIGEVFQNAYRSGATSVATSYDPEQRVLHIVDNGPGIADPQLLFTAGATGWDASDIIEPAGIGAFALLRRDQVRSLRYQSRGAGNWWMDVTPEILDGAPAVLHWEENGDSPSGISLDISLSGEAPDVTSEMIQKARAFYPLSVTFQGELVHPDAEGCPWMACETPVGLVEWSPRISSRESAKAVWEHRPIASMSLMNGLNDAAAISEYPQLARQFVDPQCGQYRWHILPECGVRPKLPDRNELLDDAALTEACRTIITSLVDYVLHTAKQASADWPYRIGLHQLQDLLPDAIGPFAPHFGDKLLPVLGWHKVRFPSLDGLSLLDLGDTLDIECDYITYYDRTALVVGSKSLALTLNILGEGPAAFRPNAPIPSIRVEGLQNGKDSPYISIAAAIHIEGIGDVPYMLTLDDEFDGIPALEGVHSGLVLTGPVHSCILAVSQGLDYDVLNAIVLRADRGGDTYWSEWVTSRNGESELDYEAMTSDLVLDMTAAFETGLTTARRAYYKLADLQGVVEDLRRSLEEARRSLEHHAEALLPSGVLPAFQAASQPMVDVANMLLDAMVQAKDAAQLGS